MLHKFRVAFILIDFSDNSRLVFLPFTLFHSTVIPLTSLAKADITILFLTIIIIIISVVFVWWTLRRGKVLFNHNVIDVVLLCALPIFYIFNILILTKSLDEGCRRECPRRKCPKYFERLKKNKMFKKILRILKILA